MPHFDVRHNMEESRPPSYYRLKPAIVSPILVCSGAIGMSFVDSPWWLLAIPFAVLASVCGQPNMNLADGCLAYLAIIIGIGLTFLHKPSGGAIWIGTLVSFYLSALEKRLTARPVYADDSTEPGDAQENKQTEQGAGADR